MIKTVLFSTDHAAASSLFNPNAYPSNLKELVHSCIVRAGILRFHVRNVAPYIEADRSELANQIKSLWKEQFKPFIESDDKADAFVQFASLGYLSALDGVLISLKSLLDVYATIVSRSFVSSQALKFNRGNVKNIERKISGGRLIKWLRQSAPKEDAEAANIIADILTKHSKDWLTDAIALRDRIVHDGEIRELKPVATTLRGFSDSGFNSQALSGPYMHNDSDVPSYCESILTNTSIFLEETIAHLPGIKMEFISLGVYGKIAH
ncbi:MAG: hypothetical protein KAT46_06205 [Deltaproteobacteria bacterium]|nr:hypothetical protein [Deltaproteobacteria bacterium]